MPRFVVLFTLIFCCTLPACGAPVQTDPTAQPVPILEQWSGNFPVSELNVLPEKLQSTPLGYFTETESFARAWQHFMPDQAAPSVDFTTTMVLFARNIRFYNTTSIVQVKLKGEALQVIAISTMTARPITDKVAMSMAVIPRVQARYLEVPQKASLRIE